MAASTNQPEWMRNPPLQMKDKIALIQKKKHLLRSPGKKGQFLRVLLKEVESKYQQLSERAKELSPLAFFKPSYEQALLLNAWMYGISFLCVYSANRIGKTTACMVNINLWLFPNDPKWRIFQPYRIGDPVLDPENANNPRRGQLVQVFPRPDISALKKITHALKRLPPSYPRPNPRQPHYHPDNLKVLQWLQKEVPEAYSPAYPDAPWNTGGTIWFGAPDQDHHEKVMFPLWKSYLPANSIDRYVPSSREITIKIVSPTGRTTCWELIGKSYESKDTKWSSGAVDVIMLTEGIKPDILKEVKLRFKDPGIGSHDFTPYLPANSGPASALAQRIAKGTEILPLRHFVFMEFSVYDAPAHIISNDKREGLIQSYKNDPEGEARLLGKFYASSMLVLSNLSRENHLLDWSKEELFRRFPNARLYRGLDPGLDHPTACAWGALLPMNVWVIYRMFSRAGLSISERVKQIVTLSNNKLIKKKWGPGPNDYYMMETHPNVNSEVFNLTVCDWHTFKKDEVTSMPYALNYQLAGLNITESVHTGPEERAQILDDHLAMNQYYPHLSTGRPPGPRVYFLKNEPGVMEAFLKWEEFYWERKKSGDDKGMPKDKVPEHGDDELDAVSYLTAGPYKWTSYRPPAIMEADSEPETHLIEAAQSLTESRHGTLQSLQTAANQQGRQIVYFGSPEPDPLDEDEERY